jgi:hypothetical protein
MDELQRLLGGSAVGLENGWHEDEAFLHILNQI